MTQFVEWDALGNILWVGLLVGAGLPALFAVGVRVLEGPGSHDKSGRRPVIRVVAAFTCFAVVVGAVVGAIVYIAAGGH